MTGGPKTRRADQLAIAGGPSTIPHIRHRRWPEITDEDIAAVSRVMTRGVTAGADAPEIAAFEAEYAAYVGVEHCVAVNTGTAALHCCAAALGLGPGDDVIVPAYTFIASALAMVYCGARPVFCDIDPVTFNIDPPAVEAAITDRTRAILAVHIHGTPADMEELLAVGCRHGIPVIEDAAQAHGAIYRGQRVGSLGICAGASLNESKNLSAGEGGAFLTNDADHVLRARRLSVFGEDLLPLEHRRFCSHGVGWNYRSQELTCARARVQLRRLDEYNAVARRNAAILTAALSDLPGVVVPTHPSDRAPTVWKYMVQLQPEELGLDRPEASVRDSFVAALRAEGVQAVVWQRAPLPALPVFRRPLRPWHERSEQLPLAPWDPAMFPTASRLADASFAIGSEKHPLYVQDDELMRDYVKAFQKVYESREAICAIAS